MNTCTYGLHILEKLNNFSQGVISANYEYPEKITDPEQFRDHDEQLEKPR
jgi:hypothetical protein